MFAVIKSGGRQYKVSVGQTLEVNRLPVEDGAKVKIEEVLLISDENGAMVGTPLIDGALVVATAVKQARGEKLIVFKYKSKKRYRHRQGHRQELTVLSIDDIIAGGKSLITGEAPKSEAAPVIEEVEVVTTPVVAEAEASTKESEAPASSPEPEKKTRRRRTAKSDDTGSKTEE